MAPCCGAEPVAGAGSPPVAESDVEDTPGAVSCVDSAVAMPWPADGTGSAGDSVTFVRWVISASSSGVDDAAAGAPPRTAGCEPVIGPGPYGIGKPMRGVFGSTRPAREPRYASTTATTPTRIPPAGSHRPHPVVKCARSPASSGVALNVDRS